MHNEDSDQLATLAVRFVAVGHSGVEARYEDMVNTHWQWVALRRHLLEAQADPADPASGPEIARYRDGERRRHSRNLHHRLLQRIRSGLRPIHNHWTRLRGRLVALLQCAAMALRRIRVDRIRLSRRTLAQRLAQHQLPVRNHRHLRLSKRLVLLLQGMVDERAGSSSVPTLELAAYGRKANRSVGLFEP